ncbi:hypothetical protein [Dyadobacter luticola]|uniref:Lipoprotein n=1 Tax=Dyadobacter luticola TaxID=1979387 RepID=A0A5R9L3E2_9BACT|nr:hypothetical protein [Dyadobacter luticola]TLV03094.1 hypothetical protein FEN17_05640 [Dyadobacter luticola]
MLKLIQLFPLFACLAILGCASSQSVLNVREISGYDSSKEEHIIFLNLKISEGKPEKVKLVSATSGNGKMKNLRPAVDYPYQIKVIPRYNSNRLETEMVFEHPLYKLVEVPHEDGKLSKSAQEAKEGTLLVRFQEDKTMERIEFYSVTPERGSVKIYTLELKI